MPRRLHRLTIVSIEAGAMRGMIFGVDPPERLT